LFAGKKHNLSRSLTYDSLADVDVNEAIESIISSQNDKIQYNYLNDNRNESLSTITSNSNTFKALLSQNLEINYEELKIMIIGSSMVGKTAILSSFFDDKQESNYVYYPTSGMEIKKIILKLNEKNVRVQFYDTDMHIHQKQKEITKTFYKICNAFFYVVDMSNIGSFEYIKSIHKNIINSSNSDISFYLFGLKDKNTNLQNFDVIQNFCRKAKIEFLSLNISEFTQANSTIMNYFNNILIRKVCNFKEKKKSKTFNTRYVDTSENIDNNNLYPAADYRMIEKNKNQDNVNPRYKYRRLSYNQKNIKNVAVNYIIIVCVLIGS